MILIRQNVREETIERHASKHECIRSIYRPIHSTGKDKTDCLCSTLPFKKKRERESIQDSISRNGSISRVLNIGVVVLAYLPVQETSRTNEIVPEKPRQTFFFFFGEIHSQIIIAKADRCHGKISGSLPSVLGKEFTRVENSDHIKPRGVIKKKEHDIFKCFLLSSEYIHMVVKA